jgi:hypothetical protein
LPRTRYLLTLVSLMSMPTLAIRHAQVQSDRREV